MAADRIDIKVTADTREATTNLSRFSERASAAAESAGRIGAGVLGAGAAMGAAAYKAAEFAAAVEQQEMAVRRLGPAYESVRAATDGVVSAQDALKAQQTLVQAGIRVTGEQLGTITRAAREYARATGTETTQALEQLTDALRTGSAEGLGRFGVSLQQGATGARAFGSALDQLTTSQQNQSVSARTLREDLDKLPEGLMALGAAALRLLEGPADRLMRYLTGLAGVSTSLRGVLREFAGAGDTLQAQERQQAQHAADVARASAQEALFRSAGAAGGRVSRESIRGLSAEQLTALRTRIERTQGVVNVPGLGGSPRGSMLRLGGGGGLGNLPGVFGQAARQEQIEAMIAEAQSARQAEEAIARIPQGPARPAATRTGRGGGGVDPSIAAMRTLRQAMAAAMVRGAPRVDIGRPDPGETLAEYLGRLTSIQQSLTSQTLTPAQLGELAQQQADTERQAASELAQSRRSKAEVAFEITREAGRRERRESLGGRALSALGIATDEEGNIPAFDALQTGADMLGQSLGTLRSGFAELFNTLASGSMSAGEAFQQFAAKTLKSLGEMSINQGIALTFQGIAALLTNPVAAPLMLAGGAGLIALGTGLGAAGAAAAPSAPPSGGAATSAARSASGASPRSEGAGAGNVTIVLSSLVPPGPRELQGLVHAQRQAGRYGLDDARMVPRQVRA